MYTISLDTHTVRTMDIQRAKQVKNGIKNNKIFQ